MSLAMSGTSLPDARGLVSSGDGNPLTRRHVPSAVAREMSENRKMRTTIVGGSTRIGRFEDIFYYLLLASWWQFLCIMFLAYVGLGVFFAGLYGLEADSIYDATFLEADFGAILFYSLQVTFGTTYGDGTPQTHYAKTLTVVQMFISAIAIAVTTGTIFTKLSAPTSQVIFANCACISDYEGVPTLSFRLANKRSQSIMLDVAVSAGFVTQEGEGSKHHVLDMIHPFMISATAQIRHRISEDSPLYGLTPETILDKISWLYVYVTGTEETFGNNVFVKRVYSPEDILFEHRFVDIVSPNPPGAKTRLTMHIDKVHDVCAI